ncbi:MAG: methionyl-tRNA formyltransferase [Candidatus Peribacteraceae bacterium]|jgi:methionyl-tRNA formyltransferase
MGQSPLRIIFLGTSPFAVPALRLLAKEEAFHIEAVITQPDKPTGRKQALTPPAVKTAALELELPVLQPRAIRKEFLALGLQRPDFLVVVSYGQILSQEILDFPTAAPVNVHASLLPRFRGASPIQHAILAGDAETGVTVQHMVRELDAGPILSQVKVAMDPRETAQTLHHRLATLGATLLRDTLLRPLQPSPQAREGIVPCGKLTRKDGLSDPQAMTAEEIDRKVRALNPWPGVAFTVDGKQLKVLESSLELVPGSHPLPCAGNTTLHLVTVQPAGKRPMGGAEWARGRQQ